MSDELKTEEVVYEEMVAALVKPGEAMLATMTPAKMHSLHMAIGVAGETAELLSCIKAVHLGAGKLDRANAIEELGDLEFYIEGLARPYGLTPKFSFEFTDANLLNIATNISIYGGDVLDDIKRECVYNKDYSEVLLAKSLDYLASAMAEVYDALQITREEAREANKVKLLTGEKARYKLGKYTDEQANGRADKEGEV